MRPYDARKSDEILVLKRGKFLTLLQTAILNREFQFARQAALMWLAAYPGDLLINYMYASVLSELGDQEIAAAQLEKILKYDPEFTEAVSLMTRISAPPSQNTDYRSTLAYLQRTSFNSGNYARWLKPLEAARQAYDSGDLPAAEKQVLEALAYNPATALPAVFHMRVVKQSGNITLLNTLAGIYLHHWPDCIQIKLLAALAEMQQGEDSAAVEKLHWAAAHDVSGQVINRLLGPNHPYTPLWPEDLKVYLDLPVPASIAVELGWNALGGQAHAAPVAPAQPQMPAQAQGLIGNPTLAVRISDFIQPEDSQATDYSEVPPEDFEALEASLSAGQVGDAAAKTPTSDPESLQALTTITEIQAAFDKVAHKINKAEISKVDSRFPVYVLLTSRAALEKKYGANTADVILNLMRDLSLKITDLPGWNSVAYIPDDPTSAREVGLQPVLASDAWKIKLALSDLDQKLSQKGEMIGALLIVGGHEIVPFHMLPNPTDDADANVPSDNPYSTLDENYFIQQWPVGRIPDESGNDAVYLLEQLRFLNNEYGLKVKHKKNISAGLVQSLLGGLFSRLQQVTNRLQSSNQIGVTAEVWKVPSAEVFSVIEKAEKIKLSPPTTSDNLLIKQKSTPKFAYFNLHGVKDSAEWYGQRDLTGPNDGLEYPVALVPANFSSSAVTPEIVMSEACYGAAIIDKPADESVALNFLAAGSRAFVGSTCIAYGSVSKPLVGADLLAYHFWMHVRDGISVGYALMRAKLAVAQKMTENQGYLDGEDQKTILSFVCYGDPLASKINIKESVRPMIRPTAYPILKTISDSPEELVVSQDEMPGEILESVKKVIKTYLPGLNDATVTINPQLTNFTLDPETVRARRAAKASPQDSQRYVVTLKKIYEYHEKQHDYYARVTFDNHGEIIKLSASR